MALLVGLLALSGGVVRGDDDDDDDGCTLTATSLDFGDPDVPGVPGANDNHVLLPDALCISEGGTVTFNVYGFHQVAIYEVDEGTTRADVINDPNDFVDTSKTIPGPLGGVPPIIDDDDDRIFLDPTGPLVHVRRVRGDPVDFTFSESARYLVICTAQSHFLDSAAPGGGMFGFVVVNDNGDDDD